MNQMQYRKLPHGAEQISILGLGTSSIQAVDEREIEDTIRYAVECGHRNSRCPFYVDQMARMKTIAAYFGR